MAEILAPVGGQQQLDAAIKSGAHAVYLGTKNFNARRNASNFDGNSLKDVVSHCHLKGIKVYVTMNTLITDGEINDAINNIYDIAKSGADAIIVQDLAAFYLCKKICPSMKLHASTQMAVTNIDGVNLLKDMGFSRVVLARELSFKEIESITKNSPIEIEVFVHGALCMSVSGNCYLSSVMGERSGNRGLCAQPCRLNFKCKGKPFALSLKDMSYIDHIKRLEEIGVASLKIEGRMKRPEYVLAAVDSCRKALCGKEYELNLLKNIFSRSGFTDGYFTGKRNYQMFGTRGRQDVEASIEALKNIPDLGDYHPEKIKLEGHFTAKKGEKITFKVTDQKNSVTVTGKAPENSKNSSLSENRVKNQLLKLGDTPFIFETLNISLEPQLFLPISELNNIRRTAIEKLINLRNNFVSHDITKFSYKPIMYNSSSPKIRLRFQTFKESFESKHAEFIILPMKEIIRQPDCLSVYKEKLVCELPALCFEENLKNLYSKLHKIEEMGIKNVLCENICYIKTLQHFNFNIMGGYGLNIQNTIALDEYDRLGINDLTVSFELYSKKISSLGGTSKRGIIGYGYLPLMKFRCCPGLGQDCKNCSGKPVVTDRLSKSFNMICEDHKYSCMLNSVPLYIGDKVIENIDFHTLFFTTETKKRAEEILNLFINKRFFESEKTSGMYFRKLK